jgi:putative ABC transport system permease protein
MPIKVGDVLKKLPHVAVVAPVVTNISANGASLEVISGIDLDTYENLGGPFHYTQGGPFEGPDDALVDDLWAQSKHVKVSDTIHVLNQPFRVAGIVEHGRGVRMILQIGKLQDLMGAKDKASLFYIKTDNPGNADLVVDEIKHFRGMEGYQTVSMAYYLSMMTPGNTPLLKSFIDVVIAISMIIGFIVIFQAMYAAVMERTREIGILKSMGASKFYIVNAILRETLLLALAGVVVGILFSLAARIGLQRGMPLTQIDIDAVWILWATILALVGAILGALYPAFKAAQKDPIDALAYE